MAVAGLRGTGSFGADERPKNFRELILFRNPNGSAPIFGLTSKIGKRSTDDPEFSWWDEPNDIVRLQVNGALNASATVVTVDSVDPTDTTPDAVWGSAQHLKPGDLLMVDPAADNANFTFEVIEVAEVHSATQFTVKRGRSGTSAAAIGNDAFLTLIGSAYAEGTAAPKAASRNPIKYRNFTQIFKDTYEITGTAGQTKFRTGDPMKNDKKRKTFDHSSRIEFAMLFGRKNESTGDNGKPLRFMGGLREQIPGTRTTVFGAAVTVNSFLDAVYQVFDFDSPAGSTRMAFCGNLALNSLNKVIQADSNSDIDYQGVFNVYGMNFMRFVTPQGEILLKTHPLLNRHALWSRSVFVLDFSAMKYVYMQGRDTKFKDDIQNEDEDLRRGEIMTECSLQLDMGGLTCAYLGNVNDS